ncbi:MAG: substrate-binding domain-containing protein [Bacteroidales bacterium]|nr:substrate-binding domain-containing protein [Bacteroidales bacterium]MCF8458142.1 substrate-binding domain-containing protein [Bacteroidales bacterium]
MKTRSFICMLAGALLFSSCASEKQKEQTITLSGAFALYPLVIKWSEEYQKEHPDVRFNISAGGAGKGMADALAGVVDLGMFSREISQEEKNQGVWWTGLTIDAVIPTISAQNPWLETIKTRGLTRDEFAKIFLYGTCTDWDELLKTGNPKGISVFTRSDACGAAETWAKYMGGKQENLQGIGIFGDPGIAEAVAKDPTSIGFSNCNYAYDVKTGKKRAGVEVAPIDINENGTLDPEEDFYYDFSLVLKAIAGGIYPSPPARELYFVAKGKPQKESVLQFIRWTLTDGQKFIAEAGYVPISQSKIDEYLGKLK